MMSVARCQVHHPADVAVVDSQQRCNFSQALYLARLQHGQPPVAPGQRLMVEANPAALHAWLPLEAPTLFNY